ncbi:hypothetical protein TWF970_002720 [Orbilia oligospora]|uniref:Uncharacterized protein n=1 Tax=Orbilia oligospora TaxID=2813651 RepID=A0A7C8RBG8_ORBOL|nr:hypothetical protein TWF970_002720 [Orbilia oligospora]
MGSARTLHRSDLHLESIYAAKNLGFYDRVSTSLDHSAGEDMATDQLAERQASTSQNQSLSSNLICPDHQSEYFSREDSYMNLSFCESWPPATSSSPRLDIDPDLDLIPSPDLDVGMMDLSSPAYMQLQAAGLGDEANSIESAAAIFQAETAIPGVQYDPLCALDGATFIRLTENNDCPQTETFGEEKNLVLGTGADTLPAGCVSLQPKQQEAVPSKLAIGPYKQLRPRMPVNQRPKIKHCRDVSKLDCDMKFTSEKVLGDHIRDVHGMRAYPCTKPGCTYRAARYDNLAGHQKYCSPETTVKKRPRASSQLPDSSSASTGRRSKRHYNAKNAQARAFERRPQSLSVGASPLSHTAANNDKGTISFDPFQGNGSNLLHFLSSTLMGGAVLSQVPSLQSKANLAGNPRAQSKGAIKAENERLRAENHQYQWILREMLASAYRPDNYKSED